MDLLQQTYKSAGVDLAEADKAITKIKDLVKSTFNSQVLGKWGQFGGCFAPDFTQIKNPVLVSSTDSVGTKLTVAIGAGIHDTVGQDIVNHCVNDILTCGSKPLFFLDYIGIGSMNADVVEQIVKGIALACRENDCALIGGEMAELPGVYKKGDYDLVGTIVGVVDRNTMIDGATFSASDVLVGFPSNGLHTNGYSLARKVLISDSGLGLDERLPELDESIGQELLKIHRSYLALIREIMTAIEVKGMAHITGGGLECNVGRVIPQGMKAVIDWSAWSAPLIFSAIQNRGHIATEEMRRVFNMGIGFVVGCGKNDVDRLIEVAGAMGDDPIMLGEIVND